MLNWSASLSTGHPTIDEDHLLLIKTLNNLEQSLLRGATEAEITGIILFLNTYTREHFKREEAFMVAVHCPSIEANISAHQALIQRLDAWGARLKKEGTSTSLCLSIYRELNEWIKTHIIRIDCKLRGCNLSHEPSKSSGSP